ncbi:MAG TPA: tetratricopeptide repeat protein [Gaiellaceae bacterium]|nr:tetratricopeptide repeat protein [Gaiellaceae bacterium]
MSARTRVVVVVAAVAVAAAGAVAGGTYLQARGERTSRPGAVTSPRPGLPPLQLDFGVRADPEARALARAQVAYDKGRVAAAAPVFRRYDSLAAQVGAAFAAWKQGGGLDALRRLADAHPRSALVRLHLGWADYWAGRNADALAAWQETATLAPDSPYGVDAEDAIHGGPVGLPPILTGLAPPAARANLPAARQLALLRRDAASADSRAKLLYGLALWNLRRPRSAERQFAAAARLAPGDPVARVAAAVGRFSKANPAAAFGKLGPLTAVFPDNPVVEFHLGLLLIYVGETKKAVSHLRAALRDGPRTIYAKPARQLLASVGTSGTK